MRRHPHLPNTGLPCQRVSILASRAQGRARFKILRSVPSDSLARLSGEGYGEGQLGGAIV